MQILPWNKKLHFSLLNRINVLNNTYPFAEDNYSSESEYFADVESSDDSSEEEQKNVDEKVIKTPAEQNENTSAESTDSFICTLDFNNSETNQMCKKGKC